MMGEIENVESAADLEKLNEQFALREQAAITEVNFYYIFSYLS